MTGRWGWRGSRGSEADDPSPGAGRRRVTAGGQRTAADGSVANGGVVDGGLAEDRQHRTTARLEGGSSEDGGAETGGAGPIATEPTSEQRDPGQAAGRASAGSRGSRRCRTSAAGRGLVVAPARDRPADLRGVPGGQRAPPGGPAVHRGAAADRAAAAADRAAAPGRDALARRDLVHGPGRDRGPGRAHDPGRRPGERRLPEAAGRGQAHRAPGAGLAGGPAVPPQQHAARPVLRPFVHFLSSTSP